ncbi:MAG: alkylmercury lyase MerB [Burkholderiales bacterium]
MTRTRPTVKALSDHMLRVYPALDATDQRLSLALYRVLAQGEPVAISALATTAGLAAEEVARRLQSWPGVYYDDERRVIGYWGLTLRPTTHRLRVDGRELYTWCAWDTLFIPALLGARAEVESVCRGSGQPVRLAIGPSSVETAHPAGLWVSFVLSDAAAMRADPIASFCCVVHFFRSPETARPWLDEHPQTFLLSLGEAHEVGRLRNRGRYGALLDFP